MSDQSSGPGTTGVPPYVPSAANVLTGTLVSQGTGGPTTIITIPAGRTWQGEIDVAVACANAGANAVNGQCSGFVSLSGVGSTPGPGNLFGVHSFAGANAATGVVGDQDSNFGKLSCIIVAGANPVLVQLSVTGAGTNFAADATAAGILIA